MTSLTSPESSLTPALETRKRKSHDSQSAKMASSHGLDVAIDFAGGVVGGTASVYVGQPLDTVKVKMQTFPHLYKSAVQCFGTTLRQDGIARGLYAGTVPSLAAQVSENAILLVAYGVCQKAVMSVRGKEDVLKLNLMENALAGSFAGFFASMVLCPTELIKCKLQAMREMATKGTNAAAKSMGPLAMTRQVIRQDGLLGLYRGLVPTLAREVFGYSFFFGGYELCRELVTPKGGTKEDLGPLQTVVCGGMGGVAFWTATFPADLIKSRVQIQGVQSRSFFPLMIHIARQEGVRALYSGLGPSLVRTFPATGMLFLAYETTKKMLKGLVGRETSGL